jgi:hypothetical protein
MSLSALADNMNVYAPSALTYAGTWSATTNYVKNNVVVGSNGSAYVLQIVSNTGTDPVGAVLPSPWVALAGGGGGGGGGNMNLNPLNDTSASGVWDANSGYAVGDVVKDTSATGGIGGSLWICNTVVPPAVPPALNTSPSTLGNDPTPWTPLRYALNAGAGINITPVGNSLTIAAVGAGGGLYVKQTGTALTAKVSDPTTVATGTYPLIQFACGLTVGHTYYLNVTFDGGANTTWTSSSSGSSLTASPFVSNTLAGLEPQIPSLFGYGQLATTSAPVATSTLANGANPKIDFPPLTYTCYYDALDANVYINTILTNGGGTNQGVNLISWTDFTDGWTVYISAVDLGLTPP